MRSRRYLALLRELRDWHDNPPYVAGLDRTAKDVAIYLKGAEHKVRKRLKRATRLGEEVEDEALHRARKAGKRARYTAELSEPVLGERASATVAQATALQDVLGEHQDSVVATAFLRRLAAKAGTTPGQNGFTFGVLWAQEQQRGHRAREQAREIRPK